MTRVGNAVVGDALKMKIVALVEDTAKQFGIPEISVEFDTLKTIFITVPFKKEKDLSQAFHPDFITELKTKGLWMSMIYAKKDKGQVMYGVVKHI